MGRGTRKAVLLTDAHALRDGQNPSNPTCCRWILCVITLSGGGGVGLCAANLVLEAVRGAGCCKERGGMGEGCAGWVSVSGCPRRGEV